MHPPYEQHHIGRKTTNANALLLHLFGHLGENNHYRQALLEILFSLRFRTEFNDWKTH